MKAASCVVATLCSLCCCGLLITISLAGAAVYLVGPAVGAAAEVMMCVNETMNDGSEYDSSTGPCHDLQILGCDNGEEQEPDPKCNKLQSDCVCSVVKHLAERKHPTLGDGLGKCCSKLEGIEERLQEKLTVLNVSEVVEGYLGKKSVEACHEVVENISNSVHDLAQHCANGELPHTLDGKDVKVDISSVITADKFEGLTDLIRSLETTKSRTPFMLPFVGSVTIVGTLLTAVGFRLRRRMVPADAMSLELGVRSQHATSSDEEFFLE